MLQKVLNFLKLRLIEVSGLAILTFSIFYLYSVATYSPENATLITPGKTEDLVLLNYSFYISDFLLQAFGLSCFLIFVNFFIWSWLIIIQKSVSSITFKFLFIVIYLSFFSLGLKILFDQSFWLPDNGNGGFLGAYLISFIPLDFYTFNSIIAYSSLTIGTIFFILSLGLNFSEWVTVLKKIGLILIAPVKFLKIIFKKAGTIDQPVVQEEPEELIPTINKSFKPKPMETQANLPLDTKESFSFKSGEYKLPPTDYLNHSKSNKNSDTLTDDHKELSKFLESTLLDFGIMGKIKKVSPGPVVTLYEFEPAAGIKTSKIVNLTDDIARSTSSISTRIAPVPGKNTIGIEIPNKEIDPVNYRQIIESKEFANPNINIPITLGKTIAGYPIVGDLVSMPHLLIAGTTGSGKSVCINTLILSVLYRHTPETCKLILIDPKMLELSVYQGIPHLLSPVITEPKKATSALKWTVREMETRYRKMTEEGVRNISGFNEKAKKEGKKVMPYIIVVVDEMADLMMVSGKQVENYIQRLAQMARAAGIHIIMATQRPSVDVITGTIKANFPTRISFQVTSKIDSRTILGEQGAEQLLGKGDMLFMSSASRMIRIHGPFVSDSEIEKVSTFLRSQGSPTYIDDITKVEDNDSVSEGGLDSSDKDELFNQAVGLIKNEGKASTSFLQRKLQIGYNRAARIIDQMEEAKIISPANHTGKREILP
ncbi:DNA translocase FtsK 4TM domain-containing protein [Candidatus Pelagibacter sp. HIMB1517]|uniref:FtsK/SpoIIIE family DNA translocase n=1 Tax=Candidatus Pelagibacter sp. HIMB1517 TaxID=3413341 RepID=UPI003F83B1C8